MKKFSTSSLPPEHWGRMCGSSRSLFSTSAWQELLERSLKCQTIYVYDDHQGFAIAVFRGGPFRIGYLGFPVGGGTACPSSESDFVDWIRAEKFPGKPICLRIPVSASSQEFEREFPFQANPETVIQDLQGWDLASVSKNLRRDINRAGRTELEVIEASDPAIGIALYEMYSGTVKRHGGAIRYNADYFTELVKLSISNSQLRILVATQAAEIAGFVVTARHGKTTYYLHGAAKPEYRKSSPSDLLLNCAIHDAKKAGSQEFSLMASPPDQPSLVRYKEKWGGTTRELRTYTAMLSPTYYLFRVAEKLYSLVR